MAKNKDEKIYCVYCGTENILSSKKCKKCDKKLNPKNRPLLDYLKEKIEDKLEGDVQDEMFAIIINFIRTHLYGSILTCSIIISAVSVVTNVVNNSNEFEEVTERPIISKRNEYIGESLTSEEVTLKYLEALKKNDVDTKKSLELNTFHSDIYSSLVNKEYVSNANGVTNFFNKNFLVENQKSLLSFEESYQIGSSYGVIPEGNYDDYKFVRYPIFLNYCYEKDCSREENKFYIIVDLELIEIDGNYYVSGSEKEIGLSIDQEINYEFLIKNNGDVSKFSKQDVDDYILNLE